MALVVLNLEGNRIEVGLSQNKATSPDGINGHLDGTQAINLKSVI